jgi:hypothetical protein
MANADSDEPADDVLSYWDGGGFREDLDWMQAAEQAHAENVRLLGENRWLRGIIGPTAHCASCGSVVNMEGNDSGRCHCTDSDDVPPRQRLAPYDEETNAYINDLRDEIKDLCGKLTAMRIKMAPPLEDGDDSTYRLARESPEAARADRDWKIAEAMLRHAVRKVIPLCDARDPIPSDDSRILFRELCKEMLKIDSYSVITSVEDDT